MVKLAAEVPVVTSSGTGWGKAQKGSEQICLPFSLYSPGYPATHLIMLCLELNRAPFTFSANRFGAHVFPGLFNV
jgi:hypothetical protein